MTARDVEIVAAVFGGDLPEACCILFQVDSPVISKILYRCGGNRKKKKNVKCLTCGCRRIRKG